jgi:hypothetical protein
MKDPSKHGATKAPAFLAAALILAGAQGFARADEPTDDQSSAAAANAPAAADETAPAAVPPAATASAASSEAAAAAAPPAAAATATPPAAPAAEPPAETVPASWFARAPLTISVGEGARQFRLTVFGFVEMDYIYDTTRSYDDAMGSSVVARQETYAGNHSRSQFSMRNSRLGFAFASPTVGGVKPIAVLEADFFGHQESPPSTSESTYFDSPTYRVRHAYVKLQNAYVDVLLGQTYDLFGWQNMSWPCSLQFLGLPNQLFSRNPQLRLSHGFGADGPLGVEVAVSASRPAQRDSQIPDGSAGLRLTLNRWLGITTPGNVGTRTQAAGIGVSGIVRRFNVNAFAPPPVRDSVSATGWGLAVDAFLPVIPAAHDGDRGNKLTFVGSFVRGTGIADLITSGGNAQLPPLQNPQQIIPWPIYEANIDSTLITFDQNNAIHTLNWIAYRGGLQYYLPPTGRILFAANFTYAYSNNMKKLYPVGGVPTELLGTTADTSYYGDVNLFWDATPAIRFGISGQYTRVRYLDGARPHNLRGMGQATYVF